MVWYIHLSFDLEIFQSFKNSAEKYPVPLASQNFRKEPSTFFVYLHRYAFIYYQYGLMDSHFLRGCNPLMSLFW